MANFSFEDADRYGGQGGGGFFQLKGDMDVAKVRFLYGKVEDINGTSVHQVEIDGKKRYVNCLRNYDDPVDACPFCKAKMYVNAKVFIPVYNVDEDKVQIWERGKTFFSKLTGVLSRLDPDYDIVAQVCEVERHGKPKDTSTTYEIYPKGRPDDTILEDFEAPKIIGGFVLDKTAEDMEYFLEEGQFPPEEDDDDEPVRRRSSNRDEGRRTERRSGRRTPASEEDTF